jgi:hypothetical protein
MVMRTIAIPSERMAQIEARAVRQQKREVEVIRDLIAKALDAQSVGE